jgi:hypothetical protein
VHAFAPGEATVIAEAAEELQLQPFLFVDEKSHIKARSGNECLGEKVHNCNDVRKVLAEREEQLIAEYDANFLASARIKSQIAPLLNRKRNLIDRKAKKSR